MHAGQSIGGLSHFGRFRSISRVRGEDYDDTRNHRRSDAQLWIGSSRNLSVFLDKALILDATRMLRFVVHVTDWLHSMVINVFQFPVGDCRLGY